jgi:hypothetical protein
LRPQKRRIFVFVQIRSAALDVVFSRLGGFAAARDRYCAARTLILFFLLTSPVEFVFSARHA